MATNKDLLEKLDTIQEKVCNQDIEQIKGDLKEIKEILLDPEDGLVVRINKNTFWRKTLTEGETNFDVIKDDVRELNSGFEGGIVLETFQDIKEGDMLEAHSLEIK